MVAETTCTQAEFHNIMLHQYTRWGWDIRWGGGGGGGGLNAFQTTTHELCMHLLQFVDNSEHQVTEYSSEYWQILLKGYLF